MINRKTISKFNIYLTIIFIVLSTFIPNSLATLPTCQYLTELGCIDKGVGSCPIDSNPCANDPTNQFCKTCLYSGQERKYCCGGIRCDLVTPPTNGPFNNCAGSLSCGDGRYCNPTSDGTKCLCNRCGDGTINDGEQCDPGIITQQCGGLLCENCKCLVPKPCEGATEADCSDLLKHKCGTASSPVQCIFANDSCQCPCTGRTTVCSDAPGCPAGQQCSFTASGCICTIPECLNTTNKTASCESRKPCANGLTCTGAPGACTCLQPECLDTINKTASCESRKPCVNGFACTGTPGACTCLQPDCLDTTNNTASCESRKPCSNGLTCTGAPGACTCPAYGFACKCDVPVTTGGACPGNCKGDCTLDYGCVKSIVPSYYNKCVCCEGGATNSTNCTAPAPACSDEADNDGDGKIDHPLDLGCTSTADTDESGEANCPLSGPYKYCHKGCCTVAGKLSYCSDEPDCTTGNPLPSCDGYAVGEPNAAQCSQHSGTCPPDKPYCILGAGIFSDPGVCGCSATPTLLDTCTGRAGLDCDEGWTCLPGRTCTRVAPYLLPGTSLSCQCCPGAVGCPCGTDKIWCSSTPYGTPDICCSFFPGCSREGGCAAREGCNSTVPLRSQSGEACSDREECFSGACISNTPGSSSPCKCSSTTTTPLCPNGVKNTGEVCDGTQGCTNGTCSNNCSECNCSSPANPIKCGNVTTGFVCCPPNNTCNGSACQPTPTPSPTACATAAGQPCPCCTPLTCASGNVCACPTDKGQWCPTSPTSGRCCSFGEICISSVCSSPTPTPTGTYTPPMYYREDGSEEPTEDEGTDVKCKKTDPPTCGGTCEDPDKVCVSKFSKKKQRMICKCRHQDASDEDDSEDEDSDD